MTLRAPSVSNFQSYGLNANRPPPIESSQRQFDGNIVGGANRQITIRSGAAGLEASVFENRTNLKLATSSVAMHLTAGDRGTLFACIDRLLDISEWEDESSHIDEDGYRTFLRFMIYAHLRRLPNLGVAPNGALLAGWQHEDKSVHVEFFPGDQCTALVRFQSSRGIERIARRGHVAGLREFLVNNNAVECIV
jgi:hypothetical protein